MIHADSVEGLLRRLAPQALGAIARRYGNFADAEDAVQEALVAAATTWTESEHPDEPLAWLVRVGSRRMADQYRRDDSRRRREVLAASWSLPQPTVTADGDDTLILMMMSCHPSLTPMTAIPLTLRAVGGLSTREIAAAFLVSESTMAQRISRAKAKIKASGEPFRLPSREDRRERLRLVLHVLYLMFNEGYATSTGSQLARPDLSGEALRLTRAVRDSVPDDPEVTGLLALMLLTDARRPARTGPNGELIPLADQERSLWDQALITEGAALLAEALAHSEVGEYQIQAAISAAHTRAPTHTQTDWSEISALYGLLEQMTANPMVTLNRAVAAAMAEGPDVGLALLQGLEARLGDHHRLHAVRAHLYEQAGDIAAAIVGFRAAAARTKSLAERNYLTTKAAALANPGD